MTTDDVTTDLSRVDAMDRMTHSPTAASIGVTRWKS